MLDHAKIHRSEKGNLSTNAAQHREVTWNGLGGSMQLKQSTNLISAKAPKCALLTMKQRSQRALLVSCSDPISSPLIRLGKLGSKPAESRLKSKPKLLERRLARRESMNHSANESRKVSEVPVRQMSLNLSQKSALSPAEHLKAGIFDISEKLSNSKSNATGSPLTENRSQNLEYVEIELQINDFFEQEAVRPVNLTEYLKELSVYQEEIKLRCELKQQQQWNNSPNMDLAQLQARSMEGSYLQQQRRNASSLRLARPQPLVLPARPSLSHPMIEAHELDEETARRLEGVEQQVESPTRATPALWQEGEANVNKKAMYTMSHQVAREKRHLLEHHLTEPLHRLRLLSENKAQKDAECNADLKMNGDATLGVSEETRTTSLKPENKHRFRATSKYDVPRTYQVEYVSDSEGSLLERDSQEDLSESDCEENFEKESGRANGELELFVD